MVEPKPWLSLGHCMFFMEPNWNPSPSQILRFPCCPPLPECLFGTQRAKIFFFGNKNWACWHAALFQKGAPLFSVDMMTLRKIERLLSLGRSFNISLNLCLCCGQASPCQGRAAADVWRTRRWKDQHILLELWSSNLLYVQSLWSPQRLWSGSSDQHL